MTQFTTWLRGAIKSRTIWFNGLLAAALPYSDQMIRGVHDNLPELGQYLPDNVFKTVGFLVVVVNLILRTRTGHSLADKGQQ